ncbi:heme ABC exporter ATP-binding protein CcmA [Sphingomonas sp. BN140010]|uniref:Heme ABC exporter ATP-binding protein CcmA n=1 Tax=Sphingomonas arvum TaxID=2992113 RepID=A0ABT3JAZ3_9SPHN|nr:heme ABC exporter ATP-binding protein CcmA [Sphingomonas sp. BN140010]MCW3796238.1 heme ABC exporter ATP-binding protein CcmA [Sphingomonas sp. BN140010]
MSDLLTMVDVACWRGGRLLFEGLSLRVAPGEGLWVRGPNGMGKSSLLRIAAGLLQPLGGTVSCSACALADEALALDRELPLRRALGLWAALDGSRHVPAALGALGLAALAEVPVRLLSTGQARRARLARVLASGSPLWLLDEPLNGLDEASVAAVAAMISAHRAAGGGVLVASHLEVPGGAWRTLELAA